MMSGRAIKEIAGSPIGIYIRNVDINAKLE